MEPKGITYKEAGVDIDKADTFIERIKKSVKATRRSEVISDIGGFGGLFGLNSARYKEPVLVASTDGVGTKLKIAFLMNQHDTIGIDLVAMSVNDVIVQGAEPLFFLDYFATGKLDLKIAEGVMQGIVKGCKEAGCSLLGGETAELPSFYAPGEYDLAGFAVGVVDRDKVIDGSTVSIGDSLIGVASSGLHSNGYSLIRRVIFDEMKLKVTDPFPNVDWTIGEELLRPTKIYVKLILSLIRNYNIKGIAHITGGGIIENLPRVLPKGCQAVIDKGTWPLPPIFEMIQSGGHIAEEEMWRTFNMGIGMILVVSEKQAEDILIQIQASKEKAYRIGKIEKGSGAPQVKIA
ncbi:MAG: phosphoribosylformylglycinamidine cyclo-ligase [Deltaproteobacteria bacterium]|nr:phosphoribosylformylglycinamidine cyclo-ligase [Deltaproteobacteria bacterium]